jgi:beta-galactosidase
LSAGADAILFWCWRDEVFGRESTGFGLAGRDGLAEARLSAMHKTGEVLARYGDLLEAYEPVDAEVGIFFSPQSYYLYWAQEGTAQKALSGIRGYARALVRQAVPYRIVEENHLDQLAGLKLLILPRTVVMDDEVAEALTAFVRDGGMLFCESEVGSFGSNGLYRYPEDRFFAELTGLEEIGRRRLEVDRVRIDWEGKRYALPAHQWQTPRVQRDSVTESQALLTSAEVGAGEILFCGTYLGDAYFARGSHEGFEAFVMDLVNRAGVTRPVRVVSPHAHSTTFTHVRIGQSGDSTLIFVFASSPEETVELAFPEGTLGDGVVDLLSDHELRVVGGDEGEARVILGPTDWGISVLRG